jgi:hypothetical protein
MWPLCTPVKGAQQLPVPNFFVIPGLDPGIQGFETGFQQQLCVCRALRCLPPWIPASSAGMTAVKSGTGRDYAPEVLKIEAGTPDEGTVHAGGWIN